MSFPWNDAPAKPAAARRRAATENADRYNIITGSAGPAPKMAQPTARGWDARDYVQPKAGAPAAASAAAAAAAASADAFSLAGGSDAAVGDRWSRNNKCGDFSAAAAAAAYSQNRSANAQVQRRAVGGNGDESASACIFGR